MTDNKEESKMNNKWIVAIVVSVAMVLMLLIMVVKCIGWINTEVDLSTRFDAEIKVTESYYDKMWKILQSQAGIVDKYAGDFHKIYKDIMGGRYSSGGGLMKWVQERNPQFDSKMYEKLMASVEAQREGFHRQQSKVVDIIREHDNLRKKFPSSLIVGGADPLEYEIISSSKAKEVMETRREDDIDLFKSEDK